MSDFDIRIILIWGIAIIATIILLIIKRKQLDINYSAVKICGAIGVILLLISVTGNSLREDNWNSDYLFDFLLFKKVGIKGFRKILILGYSFIIIDIVLFALVKKGLKKVKRSMN